MSNRSLLARAQRASAIVVMLATFGPARLAAQQPTPPTETEAVQAGVGKEEGRGFFKALFSNLKDDVRHIPRKNSLYWLAAGSGLALAVHPKDDKINERLVGSDLADKGFKAGKYIGSFPFVLGTSIATYAIGRAGDHPRGKHLGTDLIEATLLSEGITQGIKAIVRRQRPLRADGTRAPGFSFPSGHSSVTFAAATVLQQHLGWKAAVPTYLVASYVAISRLHDNRHFASDVAFGAGNGIIIGRSVTWHGRNFYGTPVVGPGTVGFMVSVGP
jgi:hypothetical protein